MIVKKTGLDFSKVDNPVEFFLSPPNNIVLGLYMTASGLSICHFKGRIDDKNTDYIYKRGPDGIIEIDGIFAGARIKEKGVFLQDKNTVDFKGTIGESVIESKIRPAPGGPEVSSQIDGENSFSAKVDFNVSENTVTIRGSAGSVSFMEKIENPAPAGIVQTQGYIGEDIIKRKIEFDSQKGFHITGTIGPHEIDDWILIA